MEKEFTLEITNKMIYGVITTFAIIVLGIAVYAYTQSIPNPGHGANTIWISVNGTEKTLQQAINDGDFAGEEESVAIIRGELHCGGTKVCGNVTMPNFNDGTQATLSQCVWAINPVTSEPIMTDSRHVTRYNRLFFAATQKDDRTLEVKAGLSDIEYAQLTCPPEFWIPSGENVICWDTWTAVQYIAVCTK